jgi:UDP-N-acetylmuramate dehydrogenase
VTGFEGVLGVPAVLGGAIAMNAGTHFGAMSDVVSAVELFVDGQLVRVPTSDLGFAYRHTTLPAGAIITAAQVRLVAASAAEVQTKLTRVDAARRGQPKVKSAGCAFKNPPHDSAGKLIDQAGLKGLRVGGAMIAVEHGNFIVNLGTATARDVCTLLERVRARLPELEPEWRIWGLPSVEGEDVTCAA